jgi:PEP-CTERM motif
MIESRANDSGECGGIHDPEIARRGRGVCRAWRSRYERAEQTRASTAGGAGLERIRAVRFGIALSILVLKSGFTLVNASDARCAMRVWSGFFVVLATLSLAALPASADPVTFNIEAHITQILSGLPGADLLVSQAGIEVGDPITGSYTFDSLTPGVSGDYHINGRFALLVGGYTFSADVYDINVNPLCNNLTCAQYSAGVRPILNALATTDVPGFPAASWELNIANALIVSDALPLVPPPLNGAFFAVSLWEDPNQIQAAQLNTQVNSFTLASAAVPEPSSLWLLAVGVTTVATRTFWQRKSRHSSHKSREDLT